MKEEKGFRFSVKKPTDVKQAIQMACSGIKEKGGRFSGNEERGSLSVMGIEGEYSVADMIYLTITKKPFFIPNSTIEKEVKCAFESARRI